MTVFCTNLLLCPASRIQSPGQTNEHLPTAIDYSLWVSSGSFFTGVYLSSVYLLYRYSRRGPTRLNMCRQTDLVGWLVVELECLVKRAVLIWNRDRLHRRVFEWIFCLIANRKIWEDYKDLIPTYNDMGMCSSTIKLRYSIESLSLMAHFISLYGLTF